MRYPSLAAVVLAALLAACAAPPPAPSASVQQAAAASKTGLKFSYPTAQRNVVALTEPERQYMLNEMRYYLDMLWVMSHALANDDYDTVAKVARSRTPAMDSTPLPATLEARLPPDFQAYWRSTHKLIDDLAANAEKSRDSRDTLRRVGVLLQRCNECHAIYQFRTQ